MKKCTNEPDQSTISQNDIPRRVTRQQTEISRDMDTRTRSRSQTHMISLGYRNDTCQSLNLIAGPWQRHLTEIFKTNDPRANFSRMIESKYVEIRFLVYKNKFRAMLRTELPDGANLITAIYVHAIKSDKDKEERYKARYVSGRDLDIIKDYLAYGVHTIQCASVRMVLFAAKIKGFRI